MDDRVEWECENCGCRTFTVRIGIGTFCRVCLSRLLHPEGWPFDEVRWSVIVDAWRERLARGHPIRAAGE